MSGGFEYIDIILLAMIAGFIFLRLKNILGRKTGHQGQPDMRRSSVLSDVILQNHQKTILRHCLHHYYHHKLTQIEI